MAAELPGPEVLAGAARELADRVPWATVGGQPGSVVLDVPTERWAETARLLRGATAPSYAWFDFLTAVDLLDDPTSNGGYRVVLALRDPATALAVVVRATLPRHDPTIASLAHDLPGADWAERETAEMFGIRFAGHPDPRPLLLPDTFDGYPLRRDFPLAARAVRPWPGAHDPAASSSGTTGPGRGRRARPLGVPEDWLDDPDGPGER